MRCMIAGCEEKATVFGPSCGGVCDPHAKRGLREGDLDLHLDIHRQHHQRLTETGPCAST